APSPEPRTLERQPHAQEEAARIKEADGITKRSEPGSGYQILVANRALIVQHVEDVDKELCADIGEPLLVLRPQIELCPAWILPRADRVRRHPVVGDAGVVVR